MRIKPCPGDVIDEHGTRTSYLYVGVSVRPTGEWFVMARENGNPEAVTTNPMLVIASHSSTENSMNHVIFVLTEDAIGWTYY